MMTSKEFKSFADRAKALSIDQQSRLLKAIVTALEMTDSASAAEWRYALSREIERYPEPMTPTGDEFTEAFQAFVFAVSEHAALNTPTSTEKLVYCAQRIHTAIPDAVRSLRTAFERIQAEIG